MGGGGGGGGRDLWPIPSGIYWTRGSKIDFYQTVVEHGSLTGRNRPIPEIQGENKYGRSTVAL